MGAVNTAGAAVSFVAAAESMAIATARMTAQAAEEPQAHAENLDASTTVMTSVFA